MLFLKQKTADEMRISDWSSDVCSAVLVGGLVLADAVGHPLLADRDVTVLQGCEDQPHRPAGACVLRPHRILQGTAKLLAQHSVSPHGSTSPPASNPPAADLTRSPLTIHPAASFLHISLFPPSPRSSPPP